MNENSAANFRVLIVEDEVEIARILCEYLSSAGFSVSVNQSGEGVVDAVRKDPPDVILLDIMLPVTDGLEICKSIRKFSNIPIIMISARVEELDRLIGLELGADDYICKPFSPREVVARVKVVHRRLRQAADVESELRLFQVDDEQNRIFLNGTPLELTRMEFNLLKLFTKRPGIVFSRDQLLDLCSQPDQQATDRVIDSHIKNLRKKLSVVVPDKEFLHAVYGAGYRFEVSDKSVTGKRT